MGLRDVIAFLEEERLLNEAHYHRAETEELKEEYSGFAKDCEKASLILHALLPFVEEE